MRQGDIVSPKLFTATLESIFRQMTWKSSGSKIDGKYRSNLHFADDTLMCANIPHELQQMLQELSGETVHMGLKMNKSKIKVMIGND